MSIYIIEFLTTYYQLKIFKNFKHQSDPDDPLSLGLTTLYHRYTQGLSKIFRLAVHLGRC